MKKKIPLFLSLITLTSMCGFLSSCGETKTVKAHLDYGEYRSEELKSVYDIPELTYDELASKVSHEQSFLLFPYHDGCGCWIDFQPVLVDFFNKYHIQINYISTSKFTDGKDKFNLHLVDADMPAVCIFAKGKLQVELTYSSKSRDTFKNSAVLYDFISQNAVLPKQYFIDKGILDSYISENKEFNLYVSRTGCPDCLAADEDVLRTWNYSVDKVNEPLYIFDLAPYYFGRSATEEQQANYQIIKDLYGLSEKVNEELIETNQYYYQIDKYNEKLGYSTGMVPTFQRRKGSEILDMVVVLNDSQKEGVVSSYFTKERIKNMPFLSGTSLDLNMDGLQLTKSEEQDWATYWRSYKSTYNSKYHYPILKLFLSTYVK